MAPCVGHSIWKWCQDSRLDEFIESEMLSDPLALPGTCHPLWPARERSLLPAAETETASYSVRASGSWEAPPQD